MSRMGTGIIIYYITMASLKVMSYNCTGLGNMKCKLINDLLNDCSPGILLLQETWLLPNDLQRLFTLHKDYLAQGISSVPNDKILCGRPYMEVWASYGIGQWPQMSKFPQHPLTEFLQ